MKEVGLFEQVPELLEDLYYNIARYDLEYADNFRVCVVGDEVQESMYNKAIEKGCCGQFDTYTTIQGVKYRIGCNYGH